MPTTQPFPSLDLHGIPDLYQQAVREGGVINNQHLGLGYAIVPPAQRSVKTSAEGTVVSLAPGRARLAASVQRNVWLRGVPFLACENPHAVVIVGVSVAGLPHNVGIAGAPLGMFHGQDTDHGLSRRLAMIGQVVEITLDNLGSTEQIVSGGFLCDEMNPYLMGQWMEHALLHAAVGSAEKQSARHPMPVWRDEPTSTEPIWARTPVEIVSATVPAADGDEEGRVALQGIIPCDGTMYGPIILMCPKYTKFVVPHASLAGKTGEVGVLILHEDIGTARSFSNKRTVKRGDPIEVKVENQSDRATWVQVLVFIEPAEQPAP